MQVNLEAMYHLFIFLSPFYYYYSTSRLPVSSDFPKIFYIFLKNLVLGSGFEPERLTLPTAKAGGFSVR